MDIIDIERQKKGQFFSSEKTPAIISPIIINTVDIENDYVVIDYIGTNGVANRRAVSYEEAPNKDPLNLGNTDFYIASLLKT